jgi:hypothetical protein
LAILLSQILIKNSGERFATLSSLLGAVRGPDCTARRAQQSASIFDEDRSRCRASREVRAQPPYWDAGRRI